MASHLSTCRREHRPDRETISTTGHDLLSRVRIKPDYNAPKRTAPYGEEPGYYALGSLWLYGNVRLMDGPLSCIRRAFGPPLHTEDELDAIAQEAEELVLDGKTLVCGIHSPAHRRATVVPLKWGSPRILILSGGFYHHLGTSLREEPFRAARLWRYEFDAKIDLVVSRRAPDKKPTYACHNATVDRLIVLFTCRAWPGLMAPFDSVTPGLRSAS